MSTVWRLTRSGNAAYFLFRAIAKTSQICYQNFSAYEAAQTRAFSREVPVGASVVSCWGPTGSRGTSPESLTRLNLGRSRGFYARTAAAAVALATLAPLKMPHSRLVAIKTSV